MSPYKEGSAMTEFDQCPFLDRDDPRCGHVLRLEHIQETFRLCLGNFPQCSLYPILERSRKGPVLVCPTVLRAKYA